MSFIWTTEREPQIAFGFDAPGVSLEPAARPASLLVDRIMPRCRFAESGVSTRYSLVCQSYDGQPLSISTLLMMSKGQTLGNLRAVAGLTGQISLWEYASRADDDEYLPASVGPFLAARYDSERMSATFFNWQGNPAMCVLARLSETVTVWQELLSSQHEEAPGVFSTVMEPLVGLRLRSVDERHDLCAQIGFQDARIMAYSKLSPRWSMAAALNVATQERAVRDVELACMYQPASSWIKSIRVLFGSLTGLSLSLRTLIRGEILLDLKVGLKPDGFGISAGLQAEAVRDEYAEFEAGIPQEAARVFNDVVVLVIEES